MSQTSRGWFVKFQFDEQFKGDIDAIKDLLVIVTKHTITGSGTTVRFSQTLHNLEGFFASDELGAVIYDLFYERIQNKIK